MVLSCLGGHFAFVRHCVAGVGRKQTCRETEGGTSSGLSFKWLVPENLTFERLLKQGTKQQCPIEMSTLKQGSVREDCGANRPLRGACSVSRLVLYGW